MNIGKLGLGPSLVLVGTLLCAVLVPIRAEAVPVYWSQNSVGACQSSGSTFLQPRYDWGILTNGSTTENLFLDCGDTATESATSPAPSIVTSLSVYYTDSSSVEELHCGAKLIAAGIVWFSGATQTSGGTVSHHTFDWTFIGQHGNSYVSCSIPKATSGGRSGIEQIDVLRSM